MVSNNETGWNFNYIVDADGEPWFKGKEIATILGYANTKQAIIVNVDVDDKCKFDTLRGLSDSPLDYNTRNLMYINESGLYSLVMKSNKKEALAFQRWVTKEVLPSIRKTGKYEATTLQQPLAITNPSLKILQDKCGYTPEMINQYKVIHIETEEQLHAKIAYYIKRYYPYLYTDAFLGEMQVHSVDGEISDRRLEASRKGFTSGACDLFISNYHINYRGLCVEFKNAKGTGSLSENQINWLANKAYDGFKVIVSNDYDDIIKQLVEYIDGIRFKCQFCKQHFKTPMSREKHYKWFHRME